MTAAYPKAKPTWNSRSTTSPSDSNQAKSKPKYAKISKQTPQPCSTSLQGYSTVPTEKQTFTTTDRLAQINRNYAAITSTSSHPKISGWMTMANPCARTTTSAWASSETRNSAIVSRQMSPSTATPRTRSSRSKKA